MVGGRRVAALRAPARTRARVASGCGLLQIDDPRQAKPSKVWRDREREATGVHGHRGARAFDDDELEPEVLRHFQINFVTRGEVAAGNYGNSADPDARRILREYNERSPACCG